MKKRKLFIPVLVLLMVAALPNRSGLAHLARSAYNFHRYFQELNPAHASLNPVERVVYSLILANTPLAADRT